MEFDDKCHPIENLAIELNLFKFSQNATYDDCATTCMLSLLRKMELSPAMSDGQLLSSVAAKTQTRQVLDGHVAKMCRGVNDEYAAKIDYYYHSPMPYSH